jgi:hypothetical protein
MYPTACERGGWTVKLSSRTCSLVDIMTSRVVGAQHKMHGSMTQTQWKGVLLFR